MPLWLGLSLYQDGWLAAEQYSEAEKLQEPPAGFTYRRAGEVWWLLAYSLLYAV